MPVLNTFPDILTSRAFVFGQGVRILKLRFAEGSGITEDTLLPSRIVGEEALSNLYRDTLDCLFADPHLELQTFTDQPRSRVGCANLFAHTVRC